MSCPALHTGTHFLGTALTLLDCQARGIGAYGYGALADPSSMVAVASGGMLTLFVALFGVRLMLGEPLDGRDAVGAVLRIAIVLTLATSWPAWRVIGQDLVLDAPTDIANVIARGAGLDPTSGGTMGARLQAVDDGIVAMTMLSAKGASGAYAGQNAGPYGDPIGSIALMDKMGLALGRIAFLAGTIAPYAVTRIGAGLLLALAPAIAGLLLFGETAALFAGWLRGLAFVLLAGMFFALSSRVELALIEPWLREAVSLRVAGAITPSFATELVVLALAGGSLQAGLLMLAARVAFLPGVAASRAATAVRAVPPTAQPAMAASLVPRPDLGVRGTPPLASPGRASVIADALAVRLHREGASASAPLSTPTAGPVERLPRPTTSAPAPLSQREPLGSSYRRQGTPVSSLHARRDSRS
ncbi:type IV secretion system protein [uncultured Sphingomonas sp.]|uniref:type IV secretion system protein n=1 Tax=uncultured Sphingomonas sp. TaxID=158754 RepID=UPI0025E86DDC|nr:type IV secretion system protein [uncultured Sphingomonas sp.]